MVEDDAAVISGPAVDAGVVCPAARIAHIGWDDTDGEPISQEEFFRLTDEALVTGDITIGRIYREYRCDDGSGSFVMAETPRVSAGRWDTYGFNADVLTWEIHSGSGAYSELSGQGSIDVDYDARDWIVSGDYWLDGGEEASIGGSAVAAKGGDTRAATNHPGDAARRWS